MVVGGIGDELVDPICGGALVGEEIEFLDHGAVVGADDIEVLRTERVAGLHERCVGDPGHELAGVLPVVTGRRQFGDP